MKFIDLESQRKRIAKGLSDGMQRVLTHGQFILGPEVTELEERLSDYVGGAHVLTCSSGSDALRLSLMAYGVGPGDAVIVPALSFVATAEAVSLCGATPIFVDVEPSSFNLDPLSVRETLEKLMLGKLQGVAPEEALRPAAIVAVDLYGRPASYEILEVIAADYGILLLSDAAQSFGAVHRGRKSGQIAPCTATSFFPSKPLGCYGDGGAVFCRNDEMFRRLRSLRIHGRGEGDKGIERVGLNARLDTLQAAILLEKLEIFDDELQARRRVAEHYNELLGKLVCTPSFAEGSESAWAHYTIVLPDHEMLSPEGRLKDRERVIHALNSSGIPTRVYYKRPLHLEPVYEELGQKRGSLPVCEALCESVLSLPMHPYLRGEELEEVAACLRKVV